MSIPLYLRFFHKTAQMFNSIIHVKNYNYITKFSST